MCVGVKLMGVAVLFRRQKQKLREINFVNTSGHSVSKPDMQIYIDNRVILLSKYKHNLHTEVSFKPVQNQFSKF
jgi:hypothetical protein